MTNRIILDEDMLSIMVPDVPDEIVTRGGEGSGHHGHKGRLGKVGGSAPSGEAGFDPDTIERTDPMPGLCFECNAKWLIFEQGIDIPGAVLVHGTVGGKGFMAGRRFTHGWIEIGDWVYDRAQDIVMPKQRYYEIGQIENTVTYQPDEVRVNLLRHEHWGPWDDFLLEFDESEGFIE